MTEELRRKAEKEIEETFESELPAGCIPSDMSETKRLLDYLYYLYEAGFKEANRLKEKQGQIYNDLTDG